MSLEQTQLAVVLIGIVLTIFVFLMFFPRRPKRCEEVGDTHLDLSRPLGKHTALGAPYRQGPVYRSSTVPEPYERLLYRHPITLTPRHLEHVNILRRRDGKLPLNAVGFRTAIARQATAAEPRAVTSTNDWTAYLIAYVALSSEHQQSRVACEHTITVSPDAPFNGQGGVFAGAGATSSFDAPADADLGKAATQGQSYGSDGGFAAALGAGAALAGTLIEPCSLHDGSLPPPGGDGAPEVYSPPQSAPGAPEVYSPPQSAPGAPEVYSPPQSAPDPAP